MDSNFYLDEWILIFTCVFGNVTRKIGETEAISKPCCQISQERKKKKTVPLFTRLND